MPETVLWECQQAAPAPVYFLDGTGAHGIQIFAPKLKVVLDPGQFALNCELPAWGAFPWHSAFSVFLDSA